MLRAGGGVAGSTDVLRGFRRLTQSSVAHVPSGPCVGAQVWDLQRGNMDGSVSGRKVGNSDVPNAANDAGFGSIPQALFQAIPGTASGARTPPAGSALRSVLLLSGRGRTAVAV